MKTIRDDFIKDIAKYTIENNTTVRETGKAFGISKSSVYKYLTFNLPRISKSLYEKTSKVLEKNKNERYRRGGTATKIKYKGREVRKMEYKGYNIRIVCIDERQIKCSIYKNSNKIDEFETIGEIGSEQLEEKIKNYIDEVI